MNRRFLTLLLAGTLFSTTLYGKTDKKEDEPITKEDMLKATSNIELPSPGALVLRLKKALGDVEWKQYIELKSSKKYKFKQDLAFHLGAKGADVYFLTVAKDTSNLITISKMIYESMNNLEINNKSTKKILNALKKEVKKPNKDDTSWQKILLDISELKDGITENLNKKYKDGDKTILYNIGGWLEGYRLAANALKDKYSKEDTSILIQKDLVSYLLKKLQENPQTKKFTGYKDIEDALKEIQKILSNAKDNQLSKQDIEKLVSKLSKVEQYM
jgi:hypothetical protein